MGERCRCGAELLPPLHFCVACGAGRDAGLRGGPGQAPPVPSRYVPAERAGIPPAAPVPPGSPGAAVRSVHETGPAYPAAPSRPGGGRHRPPEQFPPADRPGTPEQRRPADPFRPARSGDPAQPGGPAPRSGPAQGGGPAQLGGPARFGGPPQFGADQQFGWSEQFGGPRRFGGSPQFGGTGQFGGSEGFGRSEGFGGVAQVSPGPGRVRPPAVPGWLIAVSVFLVVLLGTGAVVVALRPALLSSVSAASVAPATAPTASTPTTTAASPFDPAAPSSVPAAPTASGELAAQVDRDRPRAESAAGYWVPQLSSKRPGTVDGGIRYDDASILAHYRGLAARHPDAALLWSGDWPVFAGSDYWVVIDAEPFATAAQANAWCDAQGLGPDDCLAKHLSHSGGPAGTTVHR